MKLGVNIDHIAVLREARKINDPDPLDALSIAKRAGAAQITIHLREDRRHIHDSDVTRIIESSALPVNIECANSLEILDFLLPLKPSRLTLVPEKREEVTTEGGLNVSEKLLPTLEKILQNDIDVSLFIDSNSVENALFLRDKLGLTSKDSSFGIELHTGKFANIFLMLESNLGRTQHAIKELELPRNKLRKMLIDELNLIESSANLACQNGLGVYAGHGLNYQNVGLIANIDSISELNIGQSIIARAVFVGLESAIKEMARLIV
ncbi:pyridoxine 5'-phosphate synthase [Helicobacter saguini]|uniref:Pyridoxine 5'-phosphate synthase n=1 Tax=Helicobacter saguini TaxID=1548018 RepID=A0A347VN64_9HELI|nr:pyridoxine 5'-phosphate synthase [Helicobacter saguini]MWV61886.1 pyridoxine 5'-phosphate synthase [Helicobacter saguini]MWV67439.1 pyridoxine 5'-phosphate synthase [Helicobacter saguini]MWV69792.1 pyridoxine 5'-phosphate synthase [Helicobacter saguini]MWV72991.1 pyridoxine 5'-phosphate synthase [Helicobacter saguini]TLD95629.1 pyridoxine 5'-phosphate synthase [Helicobacter saguini]